MTWAPPNQRGVLVGSLRAVTRPARDARRVTTPRNPVRLTGGQARLLPADWAPGGHRRPEELPWPSRERLAKVPSYDPKAAWTSPRSNRLRVPIVRNAPSGPVSPSSGNSDPDFPVLPRRPLGAKRNLEGRHAPVKAAFPLVRRVCPGRDG